ncbi:MAG: aldose epimerase family protein [Bacteroidota bacterium]
MKSEQSESQISNKLFGITAQGKEVLEYTLTNKSGASVSIITFGGAVISIKVPDKDGVLGEVVLGFDSISQYEKRSSFGSIIGRFANRIANARFELDGKTYELEANNGPNNLHSGTQSFNREVWEVIEEIQEKDKIGIKLKFISPHMDDGFPGELTCLVTYLWTEDNALIIDYEATTDSRTIVNFTNHSYFNLGNHQEPITNHILQLAASNYLPVNEFLIPTGVIESVSNTPFDFTKAKPVGQDIDAENSQLAITRGYDHCWVVDDWSGELKEISTLYAPHTGRELKTFTTEPGVQVYTANGLSGKSRNNSEFISRGGICLETQHYPDSPNQKKFPSTILDTGEKFHSQTIYQFAVR